MDILTPLTATETAPEAVTPEQISDPVMDRAMFFMDLEIAELTAVIPKAQPVEDKFVY